MVQSVNTAQANSYGSMKKIGTTENGRTIYQVIDGDGKEAGKLSVAAKDCDIFEKSYNDIMESAPKLQEYAKKNGTPEAIKKKRKLSNRIIGFSTLAGFALPAILIRKGSTVKKVLLTLGGTLAGLAGGFMTSLAITTPPGAKKFTQATRNLEKLDVKPYSG